MRLMLEVLWAAMVGVSIAGGVVILVALTALGGVNPNLEVGAYVGTTLGILFFIGRTVFLFYKNIDKTS